MLSLGLVGAPLIIRPRTAIKEPEQIILLLVLTATSISIASGIYFLPIIISIFVHVNYYFQNKAYKSNDISLEDQIVISSQTIKKNTIDKIIETLNENGSSLAIQNIKKTNLNTTSVLKVSNF